jgi:hypothetical protein
MLLEMDDGRFIDTATGKTEGRLAGAPTTTPLRSGLQNQIVPEGDRLGGLLRNATWGFNSALFALPDAATLAIGRSLGMKEQDVFTLGKLFNKGQVAPRDANERYARAIAEGIGGTMPFTGVLAYAARVRPMVTTARTASTNGLKGIDVLKGIADDAIKFVQKNPRTAAAIDVAFGAGYEGMRQAVTENVSDENPNKQLYENLLPMGAFIGLPLAANMLPSVMAGKAIKNKIQSATAGLGDTDNEILGKLGGIWQLPGVRIVPKLLLKNAEKKLEQVFGPIAESKEAQQALRQLELALQDPRVAEAGFIFGKDGTPGSFDIAESTMYSPLLSKKAELLQQLGPKELEATRVRINENQQKLQALMDNIAPEARQPVFEAFQAAQAERQSFFEGLLRSQKDMTEAEILAVSERLGPQNMDMINNELRGALMGAMEFDYKMRDRTLRLMGLRQATSPEGLPMPTRNDGQSLFPARDMERAATGLVDKYTPERPSLRNPIPEPIAFLRNFIQGQEAARAQMEGQMLKQLTNQSVDEQIVRLGLPPDIEEAVRSSVLALVQGKPGKGTKRRASLAEAVKMDAKGNAIIPTGIPGRTITINPKQIQEDAARIALDNTQININLPEALDYLASAARFRNDALARYNSAMNKGGTRLTDAQRTLDTGTAVYNDIEKLILDHVPKIKTEYEGMKNVLADYRAGFEQNLPLLMAQKTGRGDAFLLGNEQLLQKAFSNANNLRQLQVSLAGTPGFDDLLMKGTIDWLRTKGVVSPEGLVDPKKIRSVLDKNKNIVEALPDTVQAKLQSEVALANDYVTRMGEIDARRVAAGNDELDQILKRVTRPDADPRQTLAKAVKDPATMRVLVDELGKDPDQLAALRRSIYDMATEGAAGGGALKTFIDNNEKSLKVLFKDTQHLEDLKMLADLQRRVNAFADVTGQVPAFDSLDDTLKRVMGSGIGVMSTTYRSVAEGRLSPTTGAISFLVRLTGALETNLYKRLFTKALEDPNFARAVTHVSTPADGARLSAELEKIGVPRSMLQNRVDRIARQELSSFAVGDQEIPIPGMAEAPVVSRETAASMLRALPPAPPTTGLALLKENAALPIGPPANLRATRDIPLMYPALFPNDPISGLLEQRRQQVQQGQPMQPMLSPPQR